jgi:hypothetical protein
MNKTVRAKFACGGVEKYQSCDDQQITVRFYAVTKDGENKDWSKWTPSGYLSMTIGNQNLIDHFIVGKEYFLDITEVE